MKARMIPSRNNSPPATAEVVGAGAGGGGVGAILAAVADGLPESSRWKSSLTIAAPIVAIALSGVWLFIKSTYINPYAARKRRESEEAELNALLRQAKEARDRVRSDPQASTAHKAKLESDVEELESLLLRRFRERTLKIVDTTP